MIRIDKAVTLTIDGHDVEILMNLMEVARQRMTKPNAESGIFDWSDTQWHSMEVLLEKLLEAGLTT